MCQPPSYPQVGGHAGRRGPRPRPGPLSPTLPSCLDTPIPPLVPQTQVGEEWWGVPAGMLQGRGKHWLSTPPPPVPHTHSWRWVLYLGPAPPPPVQAFHVLDSPPGAGEQSLAIWFGSCVQVAKPKRVQQAWSRTQGRHGCEKTTRGFLPALRTATVPTAMDVTCRCAEGGRAAGQEHPDPGDPGDPGEGLLHQGERGAA